MLARLQRLGQKEEPQERGSSRSEWPRPDEETASAETPSAVFVTLSSSLNSSDRRPAVRIASVSQVLPLAAVFVFIFFGACGDGRGV